MTVAELLIHQQVTWVNTEKIQVSKFDSICRFVETDIRFGASLSSKQISACTQQQQWNLKTSVDVCGKLKFLGPVFPFVFMPQIPLNN